MPIFSDSYLLEQLTEAEREISSQVRCIVSRFSLAVTQGTAVYTLDDSIIGIHRITWKGIEVEPLELLDFDFSSWRKPLDLSSQGLPRCYSLRDQGFNKLQFHPNPNETIAADDSQLNLIVGITSRVIITSIKLADPSGTTLRLRPYLRRNIMKYFVMAKAYAKEGVGQNLKASQYFQQKYEIFLVNYKEIFNKIPRASIDSLTPIARSAHDRKPPRPSLPTTGAWSF